MSKFKTAILLLILLPIFLFAIEYETEFSGLKDKNILNALKAISKLESLKKRPPKTINALRFRANSDISTLIELLQSVGYYDASIKTDIEEKKDKVTVFVFITPGPRYVIKSINIYNSLEENKKIELCDIEDKIGLKVDDFINTNQILNTQKRLLFVLSTCGYPLAEIVKREVDVNVSDKTAAINWYVDPKDFCKFGNLKISGLKTVDSLFIKRHLAFKKGTTYSEIEVKETQKTLLSSNLFSSVAIIHPEEVNEDGELPIEIKTIESLHKFVTGGVSYATIDGFGFSLGWTNRNFRSMGNLLTIDANVAQRMYLGAATFKNPDFIKLNQDYVLRVEAAREKIPVVYLAFNYSMINRVDRDFTKDFHGSIGFKAEYISVTHSGNDGKFFLFSLPFFLSYFRSNSLLNPTKGYNVFYRASPYVNVWDKPSKFYKQTFTFEFYIPIEKSHTLVLAVRSQLGSLIGPNISRLPLTKLFLGGSDDDLRGYRYRTVSPLNSKNEPVGGRSAIYFSIEPRLRLTGTLGVVPFLDIGTVSNKKTPDIHAKWLKGVGLGFRYFSFFGPLRLDFGIPLNRRKGVDKHFRVYASIGQTF